MVAVRDKRIELHDAAGVEAIGRRLMNGGGGRRTWDAKFLEKPNPWRGRVPPAGSPP